MKNKTKIIDKIAVILMTILFLVAIIYMATWSLTLMSIVSLVLPVVLLIALIIIPLFCCLVFVSIMFIIRYIQNKENRLKRILKTIAIIGMTVIIIFSAHHILLKYCLFGSYEVKVEKKLEEIEDIDLKSILEMSLERYEKYEQFEIQKVIIEPSFPDDYDINIHYKNTYGIKKVERDFISDSMGYKIVDNAENLGKKYTPLNIALFILGTISLIITYSYLRNEYKSLSNNTMQKEEELSPEKLEQKRKIAKRTIIIVTSIVAVIILIITINSIIEENKENQINTNSIKNEMSSKEDDTVNERDTLYEKVIDENIRIRVVFKGAVLAQRSIIGIEKTIDGRNTWVNQIESYDGFIQIHNGAKFVFLDENIGFINDPGLAGTDGENRGLLVTTDGGKNIDDANIIHPDNISEKNLFVSGLPYIENNELKVKIYTINYKKDEVYTYYEFISKDNGKTWKYNKEL